MKFNIFLKAKIFILIEWNKERNLNLNFCFICK